MQHIEQFDNKAKRAGVMLDSRRPLNDAADWVSLAHDLRVLATLADEIASLQSRARAEAILNGTASWENA